ncbi:MAG: hypothetical protein COA42_15325 [Alteromonadaceae bacterium]|nr:MAG: hypothetical protein COA42_15325 [Alteromonadaceae bacterium]
MSLFDLLETLERAKIQPSLVHGSLSFSAPKGAVTPAIMASLKAHKLELLEHLQRFEKIKATITSVDRGQELPLSFAQQRLWLLDQIENGSAHYNIPGALKLDGKLDCQALNNAFTGILERHESLRTCFKVNTDSQAIQHIQAAVPFVARMTDFSHDDENTRQLKVAEIVSAEFGRVFDLSCELMLQVHVLKLSEEEHVVLVVMHHIASDGWSLSILINEFSQLYSAFCRGQVNPLAPIKVQYADYAHWQRHWLQDEVLDQQLEYWEAQLAGLPLAHSLPLDYVRPVIQTFSGSNYGAQLDESTSQDFIKLCQQRGASLFMGLHAVFSVLLARFSNETDIIVGSPIANREQEEVANLIGFFANTLVLRSDLSGNPSFTELLEQSKKTFLDAYAHQQVPFEQIVERLQPERSLSHSPLFQVMLVLQNNEQGSLELPGLTLGALEPSGDDVAGTAKFDITLNVFEAGKTLQFSWEYNLDLFKRASIARMALHFECLLKAMLDKPEKSVFSLEMFDVKGRDQLLRTWNNKRIDYPKTRCIHELFEAQVTSTPEATAVIFDNHKLSFTELNQQANQLAHYLINNKNITPDTLVGICVARSLEMLVGILGILKSGGAYVPLDPEYPQARIAYLLDDAKLTTVLTQSALNERIPLSDEQKVCLDDSSFKTKVSAYSVSNVDAKSLGLNAKNLAYVIYTSGSTGKPKGVMIEHRSVINLAYNIDAMGLSEPGDYWGWNASYAFDASVQGISQLLLGRSLYILSEQYRRDPVLLGGILDDIKVLDCTPMMVDAWFTSGLEHRLPNLIIGGEAISPKLWVLLVDWQNNTGKKAFNVYGPTECAVDASACLISGAAPHIGEALPNSCIYILNNENLLTPLGIFGELHIGGVGVARGYLNRPDLSYEKFIANPFYDDNDPSSCERLYKTGDLARCLPDANGSPGYFEFQGRLDHQVKIRGFRIELGEIENTLNTHDDVGEALVIAKDAVGNSDRRLIAYVVTGAVDCEDTSEVSVNLRHALIENVSHYLAQSLPVYMVPSAFVLLGEFPLTANGKVDRKSLPEADGVVLRNTYVAPRNDIEKKLCDVWQAVLGVERVGVTDSFFQLGGDSLKAVRSVGISNKAGLSYTVAKLLQYQSIEQLVKMSPTLNQVLIGSGELVCGDVPLSTAQHFFLDTTLDKPNWGSAIRDFDLMFLDKNIFEKSLQQILLHHDVLRATFVNVSGVWEQRLAAPEQLDLPIDYVDYSDVPDNERIDKINRYLFLKQDDMNLAEAPLIRVTVFYLGENKGYVGRVVIHHLLADAYSVDIVFEDYLECYNAMVTGADYTFPNKTAPMNVWVNRLIEHVNSPSIENEVDYWLNLPWHKSAKFPVDHPDRVQDNNVASNEDIPLSLSQHHTGILLRLAEQQGIPFVSFIIAALAKTLADFTQGQYIPMRVLDSGRGFDLGLDASRTVGWFCVQRTLLLQVDSDEGMLPVARSIANQIDSMPNKGLGYELLRYYHKDESLVERLAAVGETELLLNFQGVSEFELGGDTQFSSQLDKADHKGKGEHKGHWISPLNVNCEKFTCNARVVNGAFLAEWRYSKNLYNESSMQTLSEKLLTNLVAITEGWVE